MIFTSLVKAKTRNDENFCFSNWIHKISRDPFYMFFFFSHLKRINFYINVYTNKSGFLKCELIFANQPRVAAAAARSCFSLEPGESEWITLIKTGCANGPRALLGRQLLLSTETSQCCILAPG